MDKRPATPGVQGGGGSGYHAGEVAWATVQLRSEFFDLDVELVEMLQATEPPLGSRVSMVALGALVVNRADSQLFSIAAVHSWLAGSPRRIKVQLTGDALEVAWLSSNGHRQPTESRYHHVAGG